MSEVPARPGDLAETRLRYWVEGARPQTLKLIVAPMLVGVAYAYSLAGRIAVLPVLAAFVSALLIQVATNLANDAADGARGHDGAGRLGPPRITGSGLMTPAETQAGAILASLGAALFGLVAVWSGGWPIVGIGVASLAAGWLYSYGPRPIAATPLGEVFVIVFFGVVATSGMVWLAIGRLDATALALGLAIGLPAAAVLTVNNHRDRHQDRLNGRRTLAILIGEAKTRHLYAALLLASPALLALALLGTGRWGASLMLLALPVAVLLARDLGRTPIGVRLNLCLANTAKFQLGLAVLASLILVGAS